MQEKLIDFILRSCSLVVFSVCTFMALVILFTLPPATDASYIVLIVAYAVAIGYIIIGALSAYGTWKRTNWGRFAAIFITILMLLVFIFIMVEMIVSYVRHGISMSPFSVLTSALIGIPIVLLLGGVIYFLGFDSDLMTVFPSRRSMRESGDI
jgi:hypothetical protein